MKFASSLGSNNFFSYAVLQVRMEVILVSLRHPFGKHLARPCDEENRHTLQSRRDPCGPMGTDGGRAMGEFRGCARRGEFVNPDQTAFAHCLLNAPIAGTIAERCTQRSSSSVRTKVARELHAKPPMGAGALHSEILRQQGAQIKKANS